MEPVRGRGTIPDPYQDAVLAAPDSCDLLVIGPAGTGKTTLIYLLIKRYPIYKVLYLCHTVMQRQAAQREFPSLRVQTVHAFCKEEANVPFRSSYSLLLEEYTNLPAKYKTSFSLVILEESHNFTRDMVKAIRSIPTCRRIAIYDPMQRSFYYDRNLVHPKNFLSSSYVELPLKFNYRSGPEVLDVVNSHINLDLVPQGPAPSNHKLAILCRYKDDVLSVYDSLKETGLSSVAMWMSDPLVKDRLVEGPADALLHVMTIHSAQGQGFWAGLLLHTSGLLMSELEVLYVGLTRFMKQVAFLSPGTNLSVSQYAPTLHNFPEVGKFLEASLA